MSQHSKPSPGPQAAMATWQVMQAFAEKGGDALMTLRVGAIKCAGAPIKMTFLLRDRLRQAGALERTRGHFHSALGNVFGLPVINRFILDRWQSFGIGVEFSSKLAAIDIGARRASFVSPEGELTPSLPMVESLEESYFAWLMKYRLLKPAYVALLKGRV